VEKQSQVIVTPDIQNIADGFKQKGLDLLLEILKWMHHNFKGAGSNPETKMDVFR
jgi:hypothetical protein|tara:strand:+ start:118 stop:282 length:165 start_codon:yes stop_codon:yes gene_type:complete